MQQPPAHPPTIAALRELFAADLASGRTIQLPRSAMADPELRQQLPQVLAELGPAAQGQPHFPGYTLLGEIGSGGMSTVYLARHEKLNRYVALKVVPEWMGSDTRARNRLLKEAQALAKLNHPNIVKVFDVIERGNRVAIAMEWVDGLTLAGLLELTSNSPTADDAGPIYAALGAAEELRQRCGNSAKAVFVHLMHSAALAAQHVHDQRLLHLDIKPSNVLVRRDGTALLADFGVVRDTDMLLTQTLSFSGTPVYAAPEQLARDDQRIGPCSDVYGLGITLYELLARDLPQRRDSLTELLQRVQAGRMPPLAQQSQVEKPLANVVHRAIAADPQQRYSSAGDLAKDLHAYLHGGPIAARPLSRLERLRNWRRAEPWKASLTAALLLLLAISAGLALKLLDELPHINTGRQLELSQRHATMAHQTLQTYLHAEEAPEERLQEMARALANSPRDSYLLAVYLGCCTTDQPERARRAIEAAQRAGGNSIGLQFALQRLQDGRTFFNADELAQLAASREPIDLHLRLIDRVLHCNNNGVEEDILATCEELDQEILLAGPNPMLHAMRAWLASKVGDLRGIATSCDVIERKWPNEWIIHAWRVLALGNIDPQQAVAAADLFLAAKPNDENMLSLRADNLRMAGDLEGALALWQQLTPPQPPRSPTSLHWLVTAPAMIKLLAELGRHEEARAIYATLPPELPLANQLRIQALLEPAAALQQYRIHALDRRPSHPLLRSAVSTAIRQRDASSIEQFARRGVELFTDLPEYRWTLADALWRRKEYGEAGEILRGLRPPRKILDYCGTGYANVLQHQKDWPGLLAMAQRWHECNTERKHVAAYYRGLAAARLGQRDLATESLMEHIELAAAANKAAREAGRPQTHNYREAYCELMWLEVDPALTAEQSYPAQATTFCRSQRGLVDQEAARNAWWSLLQAELLLREGDVANAKAAARRAERLASKPPLSAPADLDQRIAAFMTKLQ